MERVIHSPGTRQFLILGMQLTQLTTICGGGPIRVAPRDCVWLSQLHTQIPDKSLLLA